MKEKRQLTKKIHSLKAKECLTRKELSTMFKSPYQLEQLIINSKESTVKIKEIVCGSKENWHITYKHAYWKFNSEQINKLAHLLLISNKKLTEIIKEDIKLQTK